MTLLRNPLSVNTNSSTTLASVLTTNGVGEEQVAKSIKISDRSNKLLRGTRAERNRANVEYTWEAGGTDVTTEDTSAVVKRARELKARNAASRGLGNGIQFPGNLPDNVDLVMLNYENLPITAPSKPKPDPGKTLEWLVDAIETGGGSLREEATRWYERGGRGWTVEKDENTGEQSYTFNVELKVLEESGSSKELWNSQSTLAASDSFSRVVASGRSAISLRSKFASEGVVVDVSAANSGSTGALGVAFGGVWGDGMEGLRDGISARLAWMLEGVEPRGELEVARRLEVRSGEAEEEAKKEDEEKKKANYIYEYVHLC